MKTISTNACLIAAVLASAVLAAGGCASVERDEVAAPPNGGPVAMRVGTPLVVSLPPDPSVGYGWVLASASPNLYFIGGPDYTPAPKPPGLVGVDDTTAFRFRAKAQGTAFLEFVWQAPPDQPVAPPRTIRYDITIGPNFPDGIIADVFTPSRGTQGSVKYWNF